MMFLSALHPSFNTSATVVIVGVHGGDGMGAYASHRGGFDANKMSWCGSTEGFCLALLTFHKAVGAQTSTFSEIP